ncbi:MAG: hypothetical protein KHZ90_08510 [Veillonella parvula]|uniref:Uncharacterized protein n=1 Tax=Veillonella parvula TaxID=29466 RepID=A0A942WQX5_VEIPA|nr:hypothetical protein [Veillonella parvula]MBS4893803.1 hypothetical protein [Veillonella parvula]
MKIWNFKNYADCESYRENKDLIETWFYECKSLEDVKKLIAFLYSINEEDILDHEIERFIGEINTHGIETFLKQYYQFRRFGFLSKIILVA